MSSDHCNWISRLPLLAHGKCHNRRPIPCQVVLAAWNALGCPRLFLFDFFEASAGQAFLCTPYGMIRRGGCIYKIEEAMGRILGSLGRHCCVVTPCGMNDSGSKGHVLFEEAEAALPLLKCWLWRDAVQARRARSFGVQAFCICGGAGGKFPKVNMKLSPNPIIPLDAPISQTARMLSIIILLSQKWHGGSWTAISATMQAVSARRDVLMARP